MLRYKQRSSSHLEESKKVAPNDERRPNSVLKGVIFDLDGVLFDSHPVHFRNWRQLLTEEGRLVADADLGFIYEGARREEILQRFWGPLSAEESMRLACRKDQLFQELEDSLQTVPGLAAFLSALETRKIRLAVVTNASRPRAFRLLDRFRLTSRFCSILTAADLPRGKEDPSTFSEALTRLAVTSENCVVIEDSPRAISAAIRLGIRCVGIGAGDEGRVLRNAGADVVVPDFTNLGLIDLIELLTKDR